MNLISLLIRQPVTVTVGVVLVVLTGLLALQRIPIQLTPNVEDTIIAVTTRWEGASPEEIEREIVDRQEEKLQGLANLRTMTSESQQGTGIVRLEFAVGTSKEAALREVSDKLREVPEYPANADEPVVEASDPENRDYIAWVIFGTTDPGLDIRTLQDFVEDRLEPVLERVEGVSEINVLGGREREVQIRVDPVQLAQFGISPTELVSAIQRTNQNVSGGELNDAKFDVRLRTISQYTTVQDVADTVIRQTEGGPVYVGDVAEIVETYKEPTSFVRSKGRPVIAINAQKEVGANVMTVMAGLREAIEELRQSGGVLETEASRRGLDGELYLHQVYDQTTYIDDALALVRSNMWLGGSLAIFVLVLFLRSARSVGIVALAIPISVLGAIVVMVALGRTINVISLAGMAFAVGLVVDNAIVVLENIFRHLEMSKPPMRAALDGAREVWGAVLAATVTTIVVFIPILLIQEEAGQLFRDIALAICAAVAISLLVSVTVIPTAAGRLLRPVRPRTVEKSGVRGGRGSILTLPWRALRRLVASLHSLPDAIGRLVYLICGSTVARVSIVIVLTVASLGGSYLLMPPADYLPKGNRNLIFGLLLAPPGYNMSKQETIGDRVESTIAPFWEAGELTPGTIESQRAIDNLPSVPTFDWTKQAPGEAVVPPVLENYFFVSSNGLMFHGAISGDPARVADVAALMQHATRSEVIPGVFGYAFQLPLFRLGGSTGSAIKVDFSGENLGSVTRAASGVFRELGERYGFQTIQPSPSNFDIFGPEIQVIPDMRRLADLGMTPSDLAMAVQANGDGAIIGEYRLGADTVDLKLLAGDSVERRSIGPLGDIPIATPSGHVVPLSNLADFKRTTSPPQINHVSRQRSVTLLFTPPEGLPLEQAVDEIRMVLADSRDGGLIPSDVTTGFAGSASKLASVQKAMLGDGTLLSTLNSSVVLALLVVYLVMCVLFQSFLRPLVIMFSVPLALLGGFAALFGIFVWSVTDRYQPIQTMDVLAMLGFVILIGIVVNNAILIVHQSLNFMRGDAELQDGTTWPLPPRYAISEAVRTRVRPIFMSTLTSVGGMAPLVLMPGSGSELYRGLGSVVLGGLLVSTVFTILLVPLLLSLLCDAQAALGRLPESIGVSETPLPSESEPSPTPAAA